MNTKTAVIGAKYKYIVLFTTQAFIIVSLLFFFFFQISPSLSFGGSMGSYTFTNEAQAIRQILYSVM